MAIVVAHVGQDAVVPIRTALVGSGIRTLSISETSSPDLARPVRLKYRGVEFTAHPHRNVRLECMTAHEDADKVVEILSRYAPLSPLELPPSGATG